ncbi:MAG TPA: hypothetical protein VFB63_06240, partial [Bryobacteraceae bacterium]|nr:hypothetical protein [Bryobacteraceae bacterium]
SIENQDIGFVSANQAVRVKIAAYQFQKYGMLEGTVKTISADSSSAKKEESAPSQPDAPAFKALIQLRDQQLKTGRLTLPLAAGMQISAEIVQGRRSVMEYLLSPVKRVGNEAGMER